jgi:hypothetical protein
MEAIMADTRTDEEKKQAFLALAQAQFSDIEDLPEYGLFPNGTYVFDVTDAQIDADAGALKQTLALVEVSELENPDTPPEEIPAPGTLLGANYYGDYGIKKFKMAFLEVAKGLDANGPSEYVDQVQGAKLLVTLKQTKRKNKDTGDIRVNNEVVMAVLAP